MMHDNETHRLSMTSLDHRRAPRASALAAAAMLAVMACGSESARMPTSPRAGDGVTDVQALDVSCPAVLFVGWRGPCIAVARLRNGQAPIVSFEAAWGSSNPDLVAVDAVGLAQGKSPGSATITASYGGRTGQAPIAVRAEDALRVTSAADQGPFRPGVMVTMWLIGMYSVASAEEGHLSMRVADQEGTVAATGQSVARGGDSFVLSVTFQVAPRSTQLCRTVVLEIGTVTLVEPAADSAFRCVTVTP